LAKSKKKKRTPPLSFLDHTVYLGGFLLTILFVFFVIFAILFLGGKIAFSDPTVIGCRSGAGFLFFLPFCMYVAVSLITLIGSNYSNGKPIFGNKSIRYGEYPWKENFFPLFDPRNKHVYIRPSKIKFRRKLLLIWCIGFLIVTCLLPFSLFQRDCIYKDLSIDSYNLFNQSDNSRYSTADFSSVTIKQTIHSHNPRNFLTRLLSRNVTITAVIQTSDGHEFHFSYADFSDPNEEGIALQTMLKLKAALPNDTLITFDKIYFDRVIDDLNLTESEIQMLKKLLQNECEY